MQCPYANKCGGCPYRSQTLEAYQKGKREEFIKKLSKLVEQPEKYGQPIFIEDGQRRRASLAFEKKKGKIVLGFNAHHSKEIVDIESCSLLTDKLNRILRPIKQLLEEMFQTPVTKRPLKKKIKPEAEKGDIWLCEADNGIDIVLEMSKEFGVDDVIINSSNDAFINKVNEITNNNGFDVTIEAVGLPSTFQNCIDAACFGGRMVLIGVGKQNLDFNFTLIQKKELSVYGSRNALKKDFIELIEIVKNGNVPLEKIITNTYQFNDADKAFKDFSNNKGDMLKVSIDFSNIK